jgi:hypothetical protein
MTQWVTRRDVDGQEVIPPVRCLRPGSIVAEAGLRTTAHTIASMMEVGEVCQGDSNKRPIMRGATLAGYIDISDEQP